MKLNMPTVGPILGYTSHSENRVWFRGKFESTDELSYKRCFGLMRYKEPDSATWSKPLFNKMSANFDMSCVLAIQNLKADTLYEYQVGWLFVDAELDKINSIDADLFEWPNSSFLFKTASKTKSKARSYVVGSCRYLLKTFGFEIFDDRGDKIFKSILNMHENNKIDGMVMMGDQIYADDLSFVKPDVKLSEFLLRYRTVFSQEKIRELMAIVPTYMILDDHEIEDNWPTKAANKDYITLYPRAIHAYQIYQASHSPLFKADADGRIDGVLQKFWYQFTDGCSEWFILDCRTERNTTNDIRNIISHEQMSALLSWLDDESGKVKMIVTSVPFCPDFESDNNDKWGAFPLERGIILDKITDLKNVKVVFVSGDVHCSYLAEIKEENSQKPIAHQVVSSSFFWPYPHMKEGEIIQGKYLKAEGQKKYSAKLISKVISDDNFVKIDIHPKGIGATFYSRKGEQLETKNVIF